MRDLGGEVLSHRYRLLTRVAGGGMGEVYRGHDLLLDRTVAVKVLQPSLAADRELVGRFRAEARAAARLSHPNIVAVHDWGSEDERTYYMVMEYVSGTDLRDILVGRGSLDPNRAASIMTSVCDALAVAHGAGLVHRDVKPENILVARDGTVKVADFGIAAMVDADRTAPGGTIPGTLRYLSPEQAAGREAGPASDVWAAGAVLCELVTGKPPASGEGADLLRRRASEPIDPPSDHDPSIPHDLERIVLKACALDPAHRYADAGEMARDLRSFGGVEVDDGIEVEPLLDNVTGEIRLPDMEPTTFVTNRTRKRQLQRRRRIRAALIATGLVALLAGGAWATNWLFAPEMITVPDIKGLALTKATDMVETEGLHLRVVDRRRDPTVGENHVISQQPARGELEEGSTVRVIVSAGPPKFAVPQVIGMTREQAEIRLRVRKMEVGAVSTQYSTKPEGIVIEQSPAEGKWEWGTKVDLVLSKGPQPVTVPDVAGLAAAKATGILEDAGFAVLEVETYSNSVDEGITINSDPAGGTVADDGAEIRLFVSIGPRFEQVTMPDVRGMSTGDATAQLQGMGLEVRVVQSCPGGSTVVETHPIAGTKIREGTRVALFVC